ncbi:hypothetical protein [Sinomonas sp. G460-2]|uniref:hypothetical protein n=1 Tax=Sinomonas sp. G460-2 TaxID=3393464 RepID=UPI0039F097BE
MRALVKLRSYEAYALNPNGRYEGPEGRVNEIHLSRELRDKLKDLRSACYRENEGTWFSARIEVAEFGNLAAEFNYDDEPEWDAPPDPVAYVNDFEVFPRDEAHQPEWLKKQLAEGNKKIARHIARGGKR